MSEIKHTPGSWTVRPLWDDETAEEEDGQIWMVCHPQTTNPQNSVVNTFDRDDAILIGQTLNLLKIAQLGATMRIAQKRYFASRTQENLVASKLAESEFDSAFLAFNRAMGAIT